MPISLRISFLSALTSILGFSLLVYAHSVTGWASMAFFAWGLVIAAVGLISTLLLAGRSLTHNSSWRRLALIEVLGALALLVCLAVLWLSA